MKATDKKKDMARKIDNSHGELVAKYKRGEVGGKEVMASAIKHRIATGSKYPL